MVDVQSVSTRHAARNDKKVEVTVLEIDQGPIVLGQECEDEVIVPKL